MYSQLEVMAEIRNAEERACTSVYYLSQSTRCNRLAVDLTQRWLMNFVSPPLVPPLSIISPSPPPVPPPSPLLPEEFSFLAPYGATLSTFRMPMLRNPGGDADELGFYTENIDALIRTLKNTEQMARACISGAPLACASGSLENQCLNGGRRCADAATNAADPWIQVYFKLSRGSYLWGFKLSLPRNTQLSTLIVGPKRVEVFGLRDEPLPCAEGNDEVFGLPNDGSWAITVVCHPPGATDAQLYALSGAYSIRITLLGTFRQVWLQELTAIERPLSVAAVRTAPSPPPPNPGLPPTNPPPYLNATRPPSPSPPTDCIFLKNKWVRESVLVRRVHEPCGTSKTECCAHKQRANADAFEIDDAGCCSLLYFTSSTPPSDIGSMVEEDAKRVGAYAGRSGTGA